MEGSTVDRGRSHRTQHLILLIDDNAPIERLITLVLRSGGFDVLTARSGAEAMDVLASETPSLILCDLQLPDIDGYEVLRRIRGDARLAGIPVLAFTVMVLPDDVLRIEAAGFDGHIVKPVDPDAFMERVASFLGD